MRTHPKILYRLALPLAVAACGDSTGGGGAGVAARYSVVGGDAQTSVVGTELPQPLQVKVTDERGKAVRDQVVNFVVAAGGGHVFAGAASTNADGIAQERWTLGTVAKVTQTVEVRAVDAATGEPKVFAVFNAVGTPAAAVHAQPLGNRAVVAGVYGAAVEDSFGVVVRDQYGNVVPGAPVAWSVVSGGGTVVSPTQTDSLGVTRTAWTLGPGPASPQAMRAVVAADSVRFDAWVATRLIDANTLAYGPDALYYHAPRSAGSVLNLRVVARGETATGPLSGLGVHFQVTGGGGSVTPAFTRLGSPAGDSVKWTLGPPGVQTLKASAGGLSLTFTYLSVPAGTRTLVAQVPGRVLDADGTRVLWLDSLGASRSIKLRTGGSDVTLLSGGAVDGALFPGGALVQRDTGNRFTHELLEYRGGTLSTLGSIVSSSRSLTELVNGSWAAWFTRYDDGSVVRRNLATGASTVVDTMLDYATVGVGAAGEVAWVKVTDPGKFQSATLYRYDDGIVTELGRASGSFGYSPRIGGQNVLWVPSYNSFTGRATLYLYRPSGRDSLATGWFNSPESLETRTAGGYVAYLNVNATDRDFVPVLHRITPGGADQPLAPEVFPALDAVASDGRIVFRGREGAGERAGFPQRYITTPAGGFASVGPVDGRVVVHDNRFFEISGGSVHELSN